MPDTGSKSRSLCHDFGALLAATSSGATGARARFLYVHQAPGEEGPIYTMRLRVPRQ
jgi:hypothetical protein